MSTAIWGNQNGVGQFHKNDYTKLKIEKISKMSDIEKVTVSFGFNKEMQVLKSTMIK